MSLPTEFKLNTGASIPAIGLGTWQAKPGEVGQAVLHALKCGYRHLDCAFIYQNEKEVGEAIKASGIPREEIFITSKVSVSPYHIPLLMEVITSGAIADVKQVEHLPAQRRCRAGADVEGSPDGLSGSVFGALAGVHSRLVPNETSALFPTNPDGTRAVDRSWNQQDTWRQMEELYRAGKVKAIGVSNFSIPYLEHLEKTWTVVPAVNQVELHPYCPQHKLKKWCEDKGILLEAYCPLGSTNSPLLSDPEIGAIAAKYNVSPATILISYQVNRGCVVLPKSVNPSRIEENFKVIPLAKEDMEVLEGMAAKGKQQRVNTPAWGHDLGFDDWYGPGNKNAPK
ncbi:Glycerol dehydrogenase [Rasamsonia emersonii CBS 393.64]|uniref:D-xylose reductase [NAD(P)H] n=1 Tax=Rasamsonia emersonii (strain ATCC 16479 / CBS 393.64 / IMI 116815) TaxID=1408163 RepID=A0A0F4YE09_RASE3|nr:Glycerol dehydrogenase [Rasamsonia emersonii CBS 393.64]KKA16419.1 Glycerol dehydrogenase [Rasamsonia emersonii CBS 393.64]